MNKSVSIIGYSGHSFEAIRTLINNKFAIKENVYIGENALIGAGSVIVKNIPKNSLCYENPGRIIEKWKVRF